MPPTKLLGQRAKMNKSRECDNEAMLPRAKHDFGEPAEPLRGRTRVAVIANALVGGNEHNDGCEVSGPTALSKYAGDLKFRLTRLKVLAGFVECGFSGLAQRTKAFHLDGLKRIMQGRKKFGPGTRAPVATVREHALRVGDLP